MKAFFHEQFKAQEAMLRPEGNGLELTAEEKEIREKSMEKMVHLRAVTTLMVQKRNAAVEKRIKDARRSIQEQIYTPEDLEQQDAIQAVTDMAFPPEE